MARVMAELGPCRELDFSGVECCACASRPANSCDLPWPNSCHAGGRTKTFCASPRGASVLRKIQLLADARRDRRERTACRRCAARCFPGISRSSPAAACACRRHRRQQRRCDRTCRCRRTILDCITFATHVLLCRIGAFGWQIRTMKRFVLVGSLIFAAKFADRKGAARANWDG